MATVNSTTPTPPAAPVTSTTPPPVHVMHAAASNAASSVFSSLFSMGSTIGVGILYALIAAMIIIIIAAVFIFIKPNQRRRGGVTLLIITPDRRFFWVKPPMQVGGRYIFTNPSTGGTVAFIPDNNDMLISVDGKERMYIGFAVPLAFGDSTRLWTSTSINPNLAHNLSVLRKVLSLDGAEITIDAGNVLAVLDKLIQSKEYKATVRDPVYDVEFAYSFNPAHLAESYGRLAVQTIDRILTGAVTLFDIESRLSKMLEIMLKAKAVSGNTWLRILLIAGLILIVLVALAATFHL